MDFLSSFVDLVCFEWFVDSNVLRGSMVDDIMFEVDALIVALLYIVLIQDIIRAFRPQRGIQKDERVTYIRPRPVQSSAVRRSNNNTKLMTSFETSNYSHACFSSNKQNLIRDVTEKSRETPAEFRHMQQRLHKQLRMLGRQPGNSSFG